ncbi:DUF5107 domain-containing protein [Dictyobacter aurantiacus]|uniref:DUF5107 domain-containing protein n=1 Tax=Dictyobacter aurantiacus TaxID=1936993 RepID=A0A401ZLY1_9CHLR|nr:DUF5107 domain-containing protein [Dictyobacter aurantiacus]GCE07863.1 hypothetical protein KDAU_51920 [Dictyobacter aurantiacus]
MAASHVRVWEEVVEIPTYGVGIPDQNPMFLEKRVYQGSSGRVYPYPVIDKIEHEKKAQPYHLIMLENEYLHIEIMPELGGRIYRALDTTNQYDFVYYNRVIKPALVGLTGPWISGGIEFNWPQHHRPNTFGPVEYIIGQDREGGKTVWVSEIDRMYGTKMTMGFTLYPGKAYLEIQAQLYNRTALPQTFLWWANPAVPVNEHTQSVFPPDVHAVFDHGKRDVSRFPIATGTYYKVDYSRGVDISWYKNIPVPTSYMADHSEYDFVGGYDHARRAGILHVANHHISPGKKQWTWGHGAFGKAWDRNLTDEDGPYVELMTGVYTDNQPDFSWLQPYETKTFTQYFMPYKDIGIVKNASINAAVNLEIDATTHTATLQVYATAVFQQAKIELRGQQQPYIEEEATIAPTQTFLREVALARGEEEHDLLVTVRNAQGALLVSYRPEKPALVQMPEAARALPAPEDMKNTEVLYLAGLHLEQYRHATFAPEAYYLEGLKRDPGDIRINTAYGTLLLRRGLWREAEQHFRTAIATATQYNPNSYDTEASYQLGMTLKRQGRLDEAVAALYKSIWSATWQGTGAFTLAQITSEKHAYEEALQLVEKALHWNAYNAKGYHLKAALLRKLGRQEEARLVVREAIRRDSADFGARHEMFLLYQEQGEQQHAEQARSELGRLMRADAQNIISLATDYCQSGFYEESIAVLRQLITDNETAAYPMVHYYLGYCYEQLADREQADQQRHIGSKANPAYCFPNSLDDLVVLESAIAANPNDGRAHYYLGNLCYDKKRYLDAIRHWEAARDADDTFSIPHRNLALAYYNILNDPERAVPALEKAFSCNPEDARVLYELDQLYKRRGYTAERRLAALDAHWQLVEARDDLYLEYITLLNTAQQHTRALALLEQRIFHPWEGGEGKVTGQYVLALVEQAKAQLASHHYETGTKLLQRALFYPENLGEGKLANAQENHVHYYLGLAYEGLGQTEQATTHFHLASQGLEEPTSAVFYNDQPPDMLFYQGLAWNKLGDESVARSRFNKLKDYGEQHLFDRVSIDYFAVSLPDFLVFNSDLQQLNTIHCRYMLGLGHLGLNEFEQARAQFTQILAFDGNHQGARIHLAMCPDPLPS